MGYSYENEMAHQQWLDYAKQASAQKSLNALIASGNPAAIQAAGNQLGNSIEGRFGVGAAMASALSAGGSYGINQNRVATKMEMDKRAYDQENAQRILGMKQSLNESEISKNVAETSYKNTATAHHEYINKFMREHEDVLKRYFGGAEPTKPAGTSEPAKPSDAVTPDPYDLMPEPQVPPPNSEINTPHENFWNSTPRKKKNIITEMFPDTSGFSWGP